MKIYVASSWKNTYQQGVVAALREDGHKVYDFKGPGDGWDKVHAGGLEGSGGFGWSQIEADWKNWNVPQYVEALSKRLSVEGFNRDMNALMMSDACVMVMPCGSSAGMEMGWAVGAARFVAVYVPEIREPELMVKMADLVTGDLQEIRDALRDREIHHEVRSSGFLQERIVKWFKQNGGNSSSIANMVARAAQEFQELQDVVEGSETWRKDFARESADVVICLMLAAWMVGFDLMRAVAEKHAINESRTWRVDVFGTLSHVRGEGEKEK